MSRWLTGAVLAVAALLLVADGGEAQAVPDPTTCEGYPENRVYLENQSWVEPQTGPVSHPGTGLQGHIHVGTCFPLYQTVTSDVLSLDIRVQLHNVPGIVRTIFVRTYGMGGPTGSDFLMEVEPAGNCPTVDCDRWVHVDFPLNQLTESGWTEFQIFQRILMVNTAGVWDSRQWYNLPRWWFNVDNGAPPRDPQITNPNQIRIGGDTWMPGEPGPGATNYSEAIIRDGSFPWDFTTGEAIPVSGVWQPEVWMNGDEGRILIDPHLHAVPADFGTEVWSGVPVEDASDTKRMTVDVDTTQLSDGPHRMLLISCDIRPSGTKNCGVLVVPFTVANGEPPSVVNLESGENLVVNCPTRLTGTIAPNSAELNCE